MFPKLIAFIRRVAIRTALRKPAPGRIPRSMPRATTVDCYVVTLSGPDEEWSVLVEAMVHETVNGQWLNGDSYDGEVALLPEAEAAAKFQCTHFLGPYEFKYESPLKFVFHQWFRIPQIAVLRDRVEQYQFNRRHLVRRDRIEILRYLYETRLENASREVSSVSLATKLYTNRVFFHPDKNKMLNHCRMLLDSLVESGDLQLNGAAYSITSHALTTLSQHEEEDRRHRDMLSQQRGLKWITVALIAVGLLQAYLSWK
jgi:hypothetical protein